MTFFSGLHLILGENWTSTDVKTLFFGLHGYFQGKRKQEIAPPLFQIFGHAPGRGLSYRQSASATQLRKHVTAVFA